MRVLIVGGGPAGLYTALLLKRADSSHHVMVLERNRPRDTFGWGVVFSDQTLESFRRADEPTFHAITENFAHWDDIDVVFKGRRITSGGHGFSGIGRHKLLEILQRRACELGVDLCFERNVADVDDARGLIEGEPDLIVAADGANSRLRQQYADTFRPSLDVRSARYIWLGTTLPLDAFTFYVVENEHGVFQAHCYRFAVGRSTFIVECDETSWRAAGFDTMNAVQSIAACESLFAGPLAGHRLESNAAHLASPWLRFTRVRNERWHHEHVVLVGDAAHTAHFSIGSGTKLAMEDAIGLVQALTEHARLPDALARYQDARMTEALRLQNAARNSMEWFEHVGRYTHLEPEQFTYSLLTRSQRVSHENLRIRDAGYLEGVERWIASRAERQAGVQPSQPAKPTPPMFTPFRLRGMTLRNRIVLSPMDMYSAVDGSPTDFHFVHLGARALGGAGLLMTEMTCVSPEARITLGCTGMYKKEHLTQWRRIVEFVHGMTEAKICLQLGHSGPKGSTRLAWDGTDRPLPEGNWEAIGPSPVQYAPFSQTPREMTRADMTLVREQFCNAVRMAIEADFDMLELHCAHGYLLSSFITPVCNQRRDEYGGPVSNRVRYPLEVFSAMREIWPSDRPMSVRISATDWVDGGLTDDDALYVARAFMAAGADIIHVSTGQTTSAAKPVYGRLFQTPFSDRIRNEGRIPTIAVGNITDHDQVNAIIAAGRADLCSIGRPFLSDPHWALHAATALGYEGEPWPKPYYQGRVQLERELQRRKAERG